jgi:phosphoribosylformimino-5-aminoimidazole carboxamide ribotide isomerase
MEVIPVIDVLHGVAVAAVRGARASYLPLVTPLAHRGAEGGAQGGAEGSDPAAVARGLRSLFPFAVLYVADLDGIEGRRADAGLWARLAAQMPEAEIWLDAGWRPGDITGGAAPGATPVIGSESLKSGDVARLASLPAHAYVLSLDFKGGEFAGPEHLLARPELWPQRVIVMTLARVGSGEGPDLERLREIVKRAGGRKVYAAGGVRNVSDIAACERTGAAGVLVATALHAGTITAGDLLQIAGR